MKMTEAEQIKQIQDFGVIECLKSRIRSPHEMDRLNRPLLLAAISEIEKYKNAFRRHLAELRDTDVVRAETNG